MLDSQGRWDGFDGQQRRRELDYAGIFRVASHAVKCYLAVFLNFQ